MPKDSHLMPVERSFSVQRLQLVAATWSEYSPNCALHFVQLELLILLDIFPFSQATQSKFPLKEV